MKEFHIVEPQPTLTPVLAAQHVNARSRRQPLLVDDRRRSRWNRATGRGRLRLWISVSDPDLVYTLFAESLEHQLLPLQQLLQVQRREHVPPVLQLVWR